MDEALSPRQVAIGLVLDEDRVLVGVRPPGAHLEGCWEFPGGKREPHESIEACLIRELAEEIGPGIESAIPLPPPLFHRYDDRSVLLFAFLCRRAADAPPPAEPWRWHPIETLGDLDFVPASRPLIRYLSGGHPFPLDNPQAT